jgi:hypothetical protein
MSMLSCSDSTSGPSQELASRFAKTIPSGPQVYSADPFETPRGTTLDVQITGSAFEKGSTVRFELNGAVDSRVRVNSTRYVKSTQVIANITVAADALPDHYDVIVITPTGKKGIGTEIFEVTLRAEALSLGNHAYAVNDNGDAVGSGQSSAACSMQAVPLLWSASGQTRVLPLGTYCGGVTKGINNTGVILGYVSGSPVSAYVLWTPAGSDYTMVEVGPATNAIIAGGGINDLSELIGWSQNAAGVFFWSQTTGWQSMPIPAGATACMVWDGINNRREIVGRCTVAGVQNPYYWSSPTAVPVMLPRPTASGDVIAVDINESGMVAGSSPQGALRWVPSGGAYTSVEILPHLGTGAQASEIANDGTVVGTVNSLSNGYNRPAYWPMSGGYKLLGLSIPNSWGDARGTAVTPNGIVVVGSERNSQALRWKE